MTIELRDYFAARAMAAHILRHPIDVGGTDYPFDETMAEWAYAQADAMLKARDAGQPRKCTEQGCCYQGKPRVDSCECYKEKV